MNILGLDTCFGACSAAVGINVGTGEIAPPDKASGYSPSQTSEAGPVSRLIGLCEQMQRGHAERLAQMIEDVMTRAELEFSQLGRIAVTTGPGSFTGTRVGVATARALALAADLPLIGVSTLEVMARSPIIKSAATEQVGEFGGQLGGHALTGPPGAKTGKTGNPGSADQMAVIVDARRDQVYAQLFSTDGQQAKTPPLLLSLTEAAQIGGETPILFVGTGAKLVSKLAIDAGRQTIVKATSLQPDIVNYICKAAMDPVKAGSVKPLYMRPADAKPQTAKLIARA